MDAASPRPGIGVSIWLHANDALHDAIAAGVPIPVAPTDGPFGRTFTDPDGYAVTTQA